MTPAVRKKASAKRSTRKSENSVAVRMYDVGFGDCFLLLIPCPDGTRRVLFDCGSIKAGSAPMDDVVEGLIRDVTDPDGTPRIDVVVATHRHKDHVSGFASPAWADVEVREVWLPWTEDPDDKEAKRIRNVQSKLAQLLSVRATARLNASPSAKESDALRRTLEIAANALSNEAAMRTLHHGFSGQPVRRFLSSGDSATAFEPPFLPGVIVDVLGPSRDADVIRDMDPPAGQSYLKLAEADADAGRAPAPFGPEWEMEPGVFDREYPMVASLVPSKDRQAIQAGVLGLEEGASAALDKAVNGTSLMLVLRIGGATLLFPGDAQWGTWKRVLASSEFRSLVASSDFYKVGHHGSHNATPVEFVDKVVEAGFAAMVSTRHVDQWPRIPKKELLEALGARTGNKVARSDEAEEAPAPAFRREGDRYVERSVALG